MRHGRRRAATLVLVMGIALVACDADGEGPDATGTSATGTTGTTGATGGTGGTGETSATGPTVGAPEPPPTTVPTTVDLAQYPACALVTLEELDDITGMSWVNGQQSPPSPDQPSCTWDSDSDPGERGHLQISVVPRGQFEVCTIGPTAEPVRGLGDRAVLDETGRRLCVLSGSRYLSIFTSFFPERNDYRDVVIAIAEAALPRIDEVSS